ncbi:MAG: PD-(D/E)XK nuclease family protein [Planctomycetota bacterium]
MGRRILLLGRAGTGKTHSLTSDLAHLLRDGREREALLLVPNLSQASHLKRLLLTRHGLAGFFDESVVTFTSLAERILPDLPIGELLSGLERDLLLRQALLGDPPAAFRRVARYPGFRRAALRFLKELKQNGLDALEMEEHLARVAEERSGATRERILAFRELFRAYESELSRLGLVDHEDYLRRARDALVGGEAIPRPAFFGVDGFQNFTRLERDLLLLLAETAEETVVTLAYDAALERFEGGPFRVAHETYLFLQEHGFKRETLGENRRASSPDLARFEARVAGANGEGGGTIGAVRVLEGADPTDEADRVARTVLHLVREEGRGYRDVVVVVRDVRGRGDLVRDAFRRHGVPHRIYGADPLERRSLVRSVLNLLRIASGELTRERVLALLRSDHVVGVAREDMDRLEDDLLEGEPGTTEEWLGRVRARSPPAARLIVDLVDFGAAHETSGPARTARAVLGLVERHLAPLWVRDRSEPERVRAEAATWQAVGRAVEGVGTALGRTSSTAGLPPFVDLLAEVLRDSTVAVPDRRLHVVNVIDAREARQWEAPVVVVSGLVEGEFPRSPREDVFLSDEDRRRENRGGGLALRERLLERDEERYLFYVALTRAREEIVLTYPATDGRGEETLRSLFLDEALDALGGEGVVSRRRLSDALPLEAETADRADLRRRALLGLGEPYRAGTREEERSRGASALSDLLVTLPDPAYVHAVRIGERFLPPLRARLLDAAPLAELHPPRRGWSASALEDFAQCPFLHFAKRSLRLAESPRAATEGLDPPLLGEIAHEALRIAFLNVLDGEPLPGPEHVGRILDEVLAEKAGGAPRGLKEERATRELRRVVHEVIERERSRIEETGYRPALLEEGFGPETRPLLVKARGGREIQLRGRVDRIDVGPGGGAVLIDYKYSKHGFDKKKQDAAAEGAHLQLPIYLLALTDAFGREPEGAWLLRLKDPQTSGYWLPDGPRPDRPVALTEEELADLSERTRRVVAELSEGVLAGEVEVAPRDRDRCRWCAFADLCRDDENRGRG